MIRDGYTAIDYFPGEAWIRRFEFSYRPALPVVSQEFRDAVSLATVGARVVAEYADFLKTHVATPTIIAKDTPMVVLKFIAGCVCGYNQHQERQDLGNFESLLA